MDSLTGNHVLLPSPNVQILHIFRMRFINVRYLCKWIYIFYVLSFSQFLVKYFKCLILSFIVYIFRFMVLWKQFFQRVFVSYIAKHDCNPWKTIMVALKHFALYFYLQCFKFYRNDHHKHHHIVSLELIIGIIVLVSAILATVICLIYYWRTRNSKCFIPFFKL